MNIPFDEKSKVCSSDGGESFSVSISDASDGGAFEVFQRYESRFKEAGYALASEKETDAILRKGKPGLSSRITEYFLKIMR